MIGPIRPTQEAVAVNREHQPLLALAQLFDCVEDALVWVKDRDGRYCWVNRAFLINYEMDGHERPVRHGRRRSARPITIFRRPFWPISFASMTSMSSPGSRIVNRIETGRPARWTHRLECHQQGPPARRRTGRSSARRASRGGLTTGSQDGAGSEFGAVLAYMRDHFHTPITNQQLARRAHMSVRAFERKFRASFHVTPQKYLRKLQMRMASRALVYHYEPGPGGRRGELRVCRSEPLHARISPPLRPHAAGISRALRPGPGAAVPGTNSAAGEQ